MKLYQKIIIFALAIVSFFSVNIVTANAQTVFQTSAKSALIMDADSGTIIYKHNENERLPIASMTKIMLLDIVFEQIEGGKLNLEDKITVSENASGMGGSQVFLQANKQYFVKDLIKSVVVASANDASVALAEKIGGSEVNFVNLMNQKAKDMGLKNTLFSNCTGLSKPVQYSTAHDVAIMLKSLIKHKNYFDYSKIWLDEITHPDGSKTTLTNTNKLSKFYEGCDGGKTGFTNESKFCLAATAKRENTRLIAVVIGEESSKTRFKDVSEMFNTAFANFESAVVVSKDNALGEPVYIKGSKQEFYNAYPEKDVAVFNEKGAKLEYKTQIIYENNLKAPLKKGDKIGEIILFKDGVEYSRTNLTLREDVLKLSFKDALDKVAQNW